MIRCNPQVVSGALFAASLSALLAVPSRACIWDTNTLEEERLTSPKMAAAILDEPQKPDEGRLRERIARLEAAPRKDDPAWWNDLAGAHLRLGEPQKAVELLEPLLTRFPKDYGLHANLGTAYHLLGRYQEAEREIARDLEINPKAHFGLERYHLALLQYLVRDKDYQARHVYVDEWSEAFRSEQLERFAGITTFHSSAPGAAKVRPAHENHEAVLKGLSTQSTLTDAPPPYRKRWNLATDKKFTEGVIYMASLNREQPACWVMLGIASVANGDFNLGIAAYRRAIELDSPQSDLLRKHITNARRQMNRHEETPRALLWGLIAAGTLPILVPLALWYLFRGRHLARRARLRKRPTLPFGGA